MPTNPSRGVRDFAKYDAMATEELEEILRLDAEAPEGTESDTDLLLYVMEILAKRRRVEGRAGKTAQEALASFQQNYLPRKGRHALRSREDGYPKLFYLRRGFAAAAAAFAILVCAGITSYALGYNLWNVKPEWNQDEFHFVTDEPEAFTLPARNDALPSLRLTDGSTSFQEILSLRGLDPNLIPSQIPEGFTISDIYINEDPDMTDYTAYYDHGDRVLIISVRPFDPDVRGRIEKSGDSVEMYEAGGTIYYIFPNNRSNIAVWFHDGYECFMGGDVTVEELKEMIHSIGEAS